MGAPDRGNAGARRYLRFKDRDIEIEIGENFIGRGEGCHLRLGDPLISRHHARIDCDARNAVIQDLGSRNGTRLNGSYVDRPRALQNGDLIQIGPYEMLFAEFEVHLSAVRVSISDDAWQHSWGSITDIAFKGPSDKTNTSARWPLAMLVELLGRSILAGRERDAAGIMAQAMAAVDEMLHTSGSVEAGHMQALWEAAIWLTKTQRDPGWLSWARGAYRRAELPEPRIPAGLLRIL